MSTKAINIHKLSSMQSMDMHQPRTKTMAILGKIKATKTKATSKIMVVLEINSHKTQSMAIKIQIKVILDSHKDNRQVSSKGKQHRPILTLAETLGMLIQWTLMKTTYHFRGVA